MNNSTFPRYRQPSYFEPTPNYEARLPTTEYIANRYKNMKIKAKTKY